MQYRLKLLQMLNGAPDCANTMTGGVIAKKEGTIHFPLPFLLRLLLNLPTSPSVNVHEISIKFLNYDALASSHVIRLATTMV